MCMTDIAPLLLPPRRWQMIGDMFVYNKSRKMPEVSAADKMAYHQPLDMWIKVPHAAVEGVDGLMEEVSMCVSVQLLLTALICKVLESLVLNVS